jgi:hypothetical protein
MPAFIPMEILQMVQYEFAGIPSGCGTYGVPEPVVSLRSTTG